MATKSAIKTAKQILDRFYRDAEGRTNRQLDVYFILEDLGIAKDKSEAALEFLVSRGLVNAFGPDIAYLTDAGVDAVKQDADISSMDKVARDFAQVPQPSNKTDDVPKTGGGNAPVSAPTRRARPHQPFLMHIDPDGSETSLPLSWICTVGRMEGNDVRVNDQRASKRHAEIFYRDNAYYLRDLNSANGTLMNGDYVVEDMLLKHDDEIVIGRTMILFQAPEVIPRPKGPEPKPESQEEPATVVPVTEAEPVAATERPAKGAEPAAIKVVRGQMDQGDTRRKTGRGEMVAPSVASEEDLFAERKTIDGDPSDLFADTKPKRPAARGADLFADNTPGRAQPTPDPDLFGEASTKAAEDELFGDPKKKKGDGDDLFADQKKKKKGDDDLFAESKKKKGDDDELFADPKKKKKKSDDDELFAEPKKKSDEPRPASRAKTDLFEPKPSAPEGRVKPPPRIDSDARLMLELTGEPEAKHPPPILEELEPLPPDAFQPPTTDAASAEAPDAFDETTPTDGVLDNQPVSEEEPRDESTVMTTRDALFKAAGETAPARAQPEEDMLEELPTWGEPGRPAASVEAAPDLGKPAKTGRAGKIELYGEDLPEASPSLVNMKAAKREDEALSETALRFKDTLAALRKNAERADLPDRKELLAAIDLLERHPYIRVALKLLS